MPTSTLTSKGQTTIPKQVRDALQLEEGDRLEYIIRPGGEVVLRPATVDVRALDGLVAGSGRNPVSVGEMQDAIEKAVSEPFRKAK
jgi:antitoxin PrlF